MKKDDSCTDTRLGTGSDRPMKCAPALFFCFTFSRFARQLVNLTGQSERMHLRVEEDLPCIVLSRGICRGPMDLPREIIRSANIPASARICDKIGRAGIYR